MNQAVGYLSARPFFDERVPQHIQSTILRAFCATKNLNYAFGVVEYSFDDCFVMLEDLVDSNDRSTIVAYSIWQFPRDHASRARLCEKIAEKKLDLFFAVEDLSNRNLNANDFQCKLDLLFDLRIMSQCVDYEDMVTRLYRLI